MRFIYYFLAIISGIALTTQVGINGRLRVFLGSPVLASVISFAVGTLGLAAAYFIAVLYKAQPIPSLMNIKQTSWWMWAGGLLGGFYVCTAIIASPKIGFANMFSLVIAAQILLAVVFDHFGIFGNPLHMLTPLRALGVFLLIAGVYIIQTH